MRLRKIVVTIVVIMVIIFVAAVCFFLYGIPNSITSEIKQIGCTGVIVSIDTSTSCFMDIDVKQKDSIIKLNVCYCVPTTDFFKFVSIGDSIKKRSGQLFLFVTKIDNGITKKFEYPFCIE